MYYRPEVLKRLIKDGAILSGVIVKIENVGYVLWRRLNFDQIAELSKRYREIEVPEPFDLKFPFTPKYTVSSQPAKFVMDTIHFLNEDDDLPGVVNHKKFRLLEAA